MSVHKSVFIAFNIIVENNKLLMIQESKRECYKSWYVPAGKIEVGETILEGAIREAKEESGLIIEPEEIFHVEHIPRSHIEWIGFCVTGKVIGGKLKTKKEKDEHSIKAEWVDLDKIKEKKLRATDFLHYLDILLKKRKKEEKEEKEKEKEKLNTNQI
ncbi:8-oxo-dgdp phosphatase nudt18 [Anaeramoeba ignava]|uniref:8-oxo-dgdp phosphatase nudt18 n=1 Tax=Anaeramoeba ignava TaxID=1746090 RepID=A0A9Q0LBE9_ANAIG|nr:8-oxo-dgdp phosphatase nudt18 [Anaeramoeba ignava]